MLLGIVPVVAGLAIVLAIALFLYLVAVIVMLFVAIALIWIGYQLICALARWGAPLVRDFYIWASNQLAEHHQHLQRLNYSPRQRKYDWHFFVNACYHANQRLYDWLYPNHHEIEILAQEDHCRSASCSVCRSGLDSDIVSCNSCRTPYHRGCWVYVGRCSVFGCGETYFSARPNESRHRHEHRLRPNPSVQASASTTAGQSA